MHETVLTTLDIPLRESDTVEAEARGQQKRCCAEGRHVVAVAKIGEEEVQEEGPARGAGCNEWALQAGGDVC